MSITVGNVGYTPYSVPFKANQRPSVSNIGFGNLPEEEAPKTESKSNKALITIVALGVAAAATWFFTKGKGKPYLDKFVEAAKPYFEKFKKSASELWGKVKTFFGFGKKPSTVVPNPVLKPIPIVDPKFPKKTPVSEIINNIDTKNVSAKTRKLVEQAIEDTPLPGVKSNLHIAPTAEEAKIIHKVNAEANKASAISRQIQNNIPEETLSALEKLKAELAANTSVAPKAVKAPKASKAPKAPKAVKPEPVSPQKQAEIAQAWAELESKSAKIPTVTAPETKIPTLDEILAMYEAGKLA